MVMILSGTLGINESLYPNWLFLLAGRENDIVVEGGFVVVEAHHISLGEVCPLHVRGLLAAGKAQLLQPLSRHLLKTEVGRKGRPGERNWYQARAFCSLDQSISQLKCNTSQGIEQRH